MFVEEYLDQLRRDGFSPRALAVYVRRVARRARENAVAHPGAVRSIWSVALGFFAAAFLAAVAIAAADDRHLAQEFFLHVSLWILLGFGFVTGYVGALRDPSGYPFSAITVPTVLTLLRLVSAPAIALFLLERRFALALLGFALAAITDVADGWIARRWNQVTRLGVVLDPVVDIVFNLAILCGLFAAGLLDAWVLAVGALRYAILLVGGAWLYLFVGPVRIQPTSFGRLTGVVLAGLIGLLVALHAAPSPFAARLIPLTQIALGVLLSATVVHVVALGWYNLKLMTGEAKRTVVGDVRWGS
jgi:cardiolipin synthase (CMP-forming)